MKSALKNPHRAGPQTQTRKAEDGLVEETIVSRNPDGSLNVRTVHVSQEEAAAQVAEKEELIRRAAAGIDADDMGGSLTPQAYWADDVTGGCTGSDFWFNSGANHTGTRVCFRKNTIGGIGTTALWQFYYAGSVGTIAAATHSWWAGTQTGKFYRINGIPQSIAFVAYQQCSSCTINPQFLDFGFD